MKNRFLAALLLGMILVLAGCGDSSPPPTFVAQILSDPVLDGDITKSPGGSFSFAQGNTQFLLAGIDPVNGESRAFLDFPLNVQNGVPGNAAIALATLDVFINRFQSSVNTIPMRVELVSFGSLLLTADYDSTPLATAVTFPVFSSDVGLHVAVDVTPLMVEAQRLRLLNFQVRILEDFGPVTPGLIEINDTTGPNSGILAPLLEVTYF